mmetsp:Transcript_36276/g.107578  ORF Transcript_36276/g.107578 Transcript_36276/m.107578 type:complete len:238 (-) Transcript_36276:416-1129(-)
MEARLGGGDALQQRVDGPAGGDGVDAHHGGVREHVQHLAVRPLLVAAPPEVERQQIGRRSREADPRGEEHRAAQLLSRRRELDALVLRVGRENGLLEVPVDGLWQPAQQLEEPPHLLLVRLLEEPQRHHRLVLGRRLLALALGRRMALTPARGLGRRQHRRGGRLRLGLRPLRAPSRLLDPGVVHQRRGAQPVRARLVLKVRAKQRDEVLLKVNLAQALVAVREHGQTDDDVGVREL